MTAFSQRDPTWRDTLIGSSRLTIGEGGCCLCACAAAWSDLCDTTYDPLTVNQALTAGKWYVDDPEFGPCLLVADGCELYGLSVVSAIWCADTPAPSAKLRACLDVGQTVVIEVDFHPGGRLENHWVQLTSAGMAARGGWQILDPWGRPGATTRSLTDYLAPGWDAARGIMAALVFARPQRRVHRARGATHTVNVQGGVYIFNPGHGGCWD
jgi:hypothetical protein